MRAFGWYLLVFEIPLKFSDKHLRLKKLEATSPSENRHDGSRDGNLTSVYSCLVNVRDGGLQYKQFNVFLLLKKKAQLI